MRRDRGRATGTKSLSYRDNRGIEASEREVTIEIDLQSDLADGEACMECLGRVEYVAELELQAPHLLEGVTVAHEDARTHRVRDEEDD